MLGLAGFGVNDDRRRSREEKMGRTTAVDSSSDSDLTTLLEILSIGSWGRSSVPFVLLENVRFLLLFPFVEKRVSPQLPMQQAVSPYEEQNTL